MSDKTADPDFEHETFLQRAEMAFLLVKRAYQDRNVHGGRAFLASPLTAAASAITGVVTDVRTML